MARIKRNPTKDEIAEHLEALAKQIVAGDLQWDYRVSMATAECGLARLGHFDGLRILTRISLLLFARENGGKFKYELVQSTVNSLEPLDPAEDSEALRQLAREIRGV